MFCAWTGVVCVFVDSASEHWTVWPVVPSPSAALLSLPQPQTVPSASIASANELPPATWATFPNLPVPPDPETCTGGIGQLRPHVPSPNAPLCLLPHAHTDLSSATA